jgi:anamorsin
MQTPIIISSNGTAKISFKKQPKPAETVKVAAVEKVAWTISADDDDELIDEGLLLDQDDLVIPATSPAEGCATKKKACKDCSCGRAEEEMMAEKMVLDISSDPLQGVTVVTNKTSSCGSCYLGDAFRCGTCPYLGMPAFKPGEVVTIGLSDDL